jgi:hypothetical protein
MAMKCTAPCGGRQHLDGHGAVEVRVESFVDDAHAALAELGLDPVMSQRAADHEERAVRSERISSQP